MSLYTAPEWTTATRQPAWLIHYGLSLFTATAGLVVDLTTLKKHSVVEDPEDDTLIQDYANAAQELLEELTARSFLNKTYDLTLDKFPSDCIEIPIAPVSSVTSVSYVDGDGTTQTWTASLYQTDTKREPARIRPAFGQAWPVARVQQNAVTVRFVAGYGTTGADCPARARQAIRLYVAEAFRSRELKEVRAGETWSNLVNGLRWRISR